ncbi:transposase [Marivita sp.]|uniref:transposase n=1 Tax=Marivita sp. TaxID=2003365 RepID=UPI00261FB2C3|nr:transposase [Marivita sp.]
MRSICCAIHESRQCVSRIAASKSEANVGFGPEAAITFDRFHVIQLANAALEEVRRAEVRGKRCVAPTFS